ncbi:trypsin-like peptidase domain-containing protein [Streptomyces sp. NPDC004539]|uniref:VMAP-C domain-containing protein n=1 Tax=Streptomyces sp. NPDC004539 TaxID=3154280 RepID=UPI0033B13CC6
MIGGRAGGASNAGDAARRALRGLVVAATVRIHRGGEGYALDEVDSFLGSGFFVAPNWVLTCAHVVCGGEGDEVVVAYRSSLDDRLSPNDRHFAGNRLPPDDRYVSDGRYLPGDHPPPGDRHNFAAHRPPTSHLHPSDGLRAVRGRVVATVPDRPERMPESGNWPAPDLALVQLAEPVDDHECVYVSERPAAYFGEGRVLYAGWTVSEGRLTVLDGTLSVQGTIGGWSSDVQMRLGDNDLPYGVSGGPVIDLARGEVIGVLKARSDHRPGGTSTGIEQLRALRVPAGQITAEHDDLYQAVFHAHDRYHRDRQRRPSARVQTWTDVQGRLGARPGRTLDPDERAELLGRLADLPPPTSTRALLDILDSLPDLQGPPPPPAPRGWRDGLGTLYESARDDGALELVLDYAMRVLAADRPFTSATTADAEEALWTWIRQAAGHLGARYRAGLAEQRIDRLRDRDERTRRAPRRARGSGHTPGAALSVVVPVPSPDTVSGGPPHQNSSSPHQDVPLPGVPAQGLRPVPGAGPAVLLEILPRPWEPDRCDWTVSVLHADGGADPLPGEERTRLGELPERLAGPLAEAFRRCDEPGRPAVLQVALPHGLLGLDVDDWRPVPGEAALGTVRPVVVRVADREQFEDEMEDGELADGGEWFDAQEERLARWRWLHSHRAQAELLDCDDGLRVPVPTVEKLRSLAHGTVPVLCRLGDHRYPNDAAALARIVYGGYGVALWRRGRGRPDAVCGEFHRGSVDEIARPPSAARLPEAVHDLRVRLSQGRNETFWAAGVALLYDDPHQPLPGTGDLLEAP